MTENSTRRIERLCIVFKGQKESAEEIRNHPSHGRHTNEHNERFWSGYATGMRDAQRVIEKMQIVDDD